MASRRKTSRRAIVIAGDEHYVERAFNPAKYGEYSPEPVVEMTFPSFRDASLAPAGKHVMSAVVQYAPYGLKAGWDDAAKEAFTQTVIKTIARYAPDIEQRISASELLTPADIEREFHITGGHWHHAELTLDQFLFVRPVNGAAQYALPIDGLFLCGAGAHPGGGVSGAAGRNAARTILSREKASMKHEPVHQGRLKSPFYPRLKELDAVNEWHQWKGYSSANELYCADTEYFAIRNATAVFDLTPMTKYRITGPDALDYLNRLVTRDMAKIRPGRVAYAVWCDDQRTGNR